MATTLDAVPKNAPGGRHVASCVGADGAHRVEPATITPQNQRLVTDEVQISLGNVLQVPCVDRTTGATSAIAPPDRSSHHRLGPRGGQHLQESSPLLHRHRSVAFWFFHANETYYRRDNSRLMNRWLRGAPDRWSPLIALLNLLALPPARGGGWALGCKRVNKPTPDSAVFENRLNAWARWERAGAEPKHLLQESHWINEKRELPSENPFLLQKRKTTDSRQAARCRGP